MLSGCGQQFENKYSEHCTKMNIQTPSWCQCVGSTLDKSLTSEQKDLILNGANGNVNLSNISVAIGAAKPILEATNSCTTNENKANFAKLSPEQQCKAAKSQALKSAEPYFLALMKGERGMSVSGYQEALSATKLASSICKLENYSVNDLLNESQLTSSGFALKELSNKNLDQQVQKSDFKKGWYVELAGFGMSPEAKARVIELTNEINEKNIAQSIGIETKDGNFSVISITPYNNSDQAQEAATNFENQFAKKGLRLDASVIGSSEIKNKL
jgi:hypothetical protein